MLTKCILFFKGLGSKVYSKESSLEKDSNVKQIEVLRTKLQEVSHEPQQSTSIEFEVQHFAIQLNKSSSPPSPFASLIVNKVLTFISTRPDNLQVNGKLGSLEINDISAHKAIYPDRFLTSGKQALEFDFFKHTGPPDVHCKRELDSFFKLRMTSVKYIHTQRFLIGLTNYFQQFNQLQDALGRMRALSMGQENIDCAPQRASRIKLDVQAQTPIIVIPVHNNSIEALVLNLGNIRVENEFNRNEPNSCLIDLITAHLTDTNLYSATRVKKSTQVSKPRLDFNTFSFLQQSGNILGNFYLILFCIQLGMVDPLVLLFN